MDIITVRSSASTVLERIAANLDFQLSASSILEACAISFSLRGNASEGYEFEVVDSQIRSDLTGVIAELIAEAAKLSVVVDPDFASVVLLLDFAGVDGATDITDLSNSAHVDTFIGDAQVDTAQQFLGENSLLLDGGVDAGAGSGDRIHFPNSIDWALPGDFTWECGVRFTAFSAANTFLSNFDGSVGAWWRLASTGTKMQFLMDGGLIRQEDWTPSLNTWYHVAACRDGTDLRLFVDGVQLGSPFTFSTAVPQAAGEFSVGAALADTDLFNGNIGAIRITKGVARYTANFTPPTEFYPTS